MADSDKNQGGPRTSRRSSLGKKNATSVGPQPPSDWSPSSEPRPRPSPRTKRHGADIDVDMDIVESSDDDSDDIKASTPQRKRQPAARRPQRVQVQRRPLPAATDSDTDIPPTPLKGRQRTPRSERSPAASMRAPNASVPVVGKVPNPRPIYEEDDDDEPPLRSARPSRPASRQTVARHDLRSRSTQRYRSTTTPESRRSPRTSVSDSDQDTDATSDEEMVIQPPRKQYPRVPMAPAVPAPPTTSAMDTMYERMNRRPEIEYESPDPEPDTASRYTQSMPRPQSRSQSRAPSAKWDQYRRPRDVDVSRPASPEDDRARSKSRSRSKSRRQYDSDYNSRPPAALVKRANTTAGDSHFASSRSLGSGRSAFYADFPAPSIHPGQFEKPTKRFTTCVGCRDDRMPVERTVKLQCAHRMCDECVRRNFALSMTSPANMPPRCCSSNALIPFKKVESLFDSQFKEEWKRKYREHSQASSNRIYCPSEGCGGMARPESTRNKGGRSHARCTACSTKICCDCHGPWHRQPDCPRDEADAHVSAQPKLEGWQRCFRCQAMVEMKDKHNHMKCRCQAEFCMMCGNRWKSCPCPLYRSGPAEASRTERVRITMNPRPNPFGSGPQHASKLPSPHGYPPAFAPSQAPVARTRPVGRPSSYEEDAHLHRMYEQREEHHARRMHSFDGFEQHTPERREYSQPRGPFEFEDARHRSDPRGYPPAFGDDEYRMPRAATVVAPSPPQTHAPIAAAPARSAFEPPSRPGYDRAAPRYDYALEAQYPRGRYASPERYDGGYMTDNYTSDRRRQRSADGRQQYAHERQSRSRDRRTFAPEQRRAESVESWQHVPTRFPSPEPMPMPTQMQMQAPERHMTMPERHTLERQMSARERHFQQATERQQAPPAPEPRRASSLDRRLADRFNPESRNTPGPAGYHTGAGAPMPPPPMTSIGVGGPAPHMGIMPLVPFNRGPHPAPPPLARAATHPAQPMGMVPAPPPPVPIPTAGIPRRHTMDEDIYIPGRHPGGPNPDWFSPPGHGMAPHEWAPNGGSARAPNVRRRPPHAHREHNKYEAKPSMQAGLSGPGRGLHRVTEWVNYIEDGPPDQHPDALVA
ncbi:hypothetical protein QBC43DRAFT_208977 [Cladorrhinum sp. PSN259]|nr:hypothetical protein QBC43DRAFT_208977 [Cladorrhinum sp. PSN259]